MKFLVQVLNSTAQIILELLTIIPILNTPNFVNKKIVLKRDVHDNSNACHMHQLYAKVE